MIMLQDRVALLKVVPSATLIEAGPDKAVDGPNLFLGILGSCVRTNKGRNRPKLRDAWYALTRCAFVRRRSVFSGQEYLAFSYAICTNLKQMLFISLRRGVFCVHATSFIEIP
ncbi:hypothetical protein BDZ94DRAFT_502456 [Collybia nuda]|uniref:Uncharacterized protein n=1 Tax=Collybia nuda TaxID=64659 RepID=A0A9P5Y8P3_9AGAR|nr:hypothetical protein BDZ94DRAFT_502456 [Collybia nuda]